MVPYRVLVVDDSAFMRKIVTDLIVQDPQFMVVATASNGIEAVEAVKEFRPDAVTMDLEMPLMNGLEALQHIMLSHPTPVIMLSGISEAHTKETIKALQYGAFDFIYKPSTDLSNSIKQVGEQLLQKLQIAVLTQRHRLKSAVIKPKQTAVSAKPNDIQPEARSLSEQVANTPNKARSSSSESLLTPKKHDALHKPTEKQAFRPVVSNKKDESQASNILKPMSKAKTQSLIADQPANAPIKKGRTADGRSFQQLIAIGTSTGGPRALHEVISALPGNLPAPVLVVQHMPAKFTKSLAQRLDSFSELRVVEAAHGDPLEAGVVYIAPGGFHMELAKNNDGYSVVLTQQPPRNGHRPSVDMLFESLTPFPELKRHAVIMTGMGSDGALGLKRLMESGGETAIAEAEESCIVFGMPRAAIELGCVKKIVPLQHIAAHIVQAVMK